jgi:glycosyltransferase involved in cell wall biosynthesis
MDHDGRLRMLFVAHNSGLYGAQRVLLTLLEGIDKRTFDCHVVAPGNGPFVAEVRRLGLPVYLRSMVRWVPAVQDLRRVGRFRYTKEFITGLRARAWAIANLLTRHGIQVVCTNTIVSLEGAIAARMAAVPHIWYITEPIVANPELRKILPGFLYSAAVSALSRNVIFCSQSLSADYPGLHGKGSVVYPGLPLPSPRERVAARARLLAEVGLTQDAKLVGVVGALQPRKDHATFLAAARRLSERHRNAYFLIVGSGSEEFTADIANRVRTSGLDRNTRLIGWWPTDIHDLMAGLDVLVIPSVQESFGLTAVEALAVGTPVVATRCGGPSEIVRDGVDGRLVPVGDELSMAEAIEDLLLNPAAARALAASGRERVEKEFTAEAYVRNMEEVLKRVTRK